MSQVPMPFDEYQVKLHASWQKQIEGGLIHYVFKNGLIALFLYSAAVATVILFFHGRAYASSRTSGYWIALGVILVCSSFSQAVLNYYSLKRRLAKHWASQV